jgi:hypothetical protein
MGTSDGPGRSLWNWAFGKHEPRPPDPGRTVEAAWVPTWQAQMLTDELVAEGIPAVVTDDFGMYITTYSREPMSRIFVTEDRLAEAEALIEEITGDPPRHRNH